MNRPRVIIPGLLFATIAMAAASCTVTPNESTDNHLIQNASLFSVVGDGSPQHQALVSDLGTLGLISVKFETIAQAIFHPMATHTTKKSLNEKFSSFEPGAVSPERYTRSNVEIDGIVTSFDASSGTLDVEGIEIKTCGVTGYSDGKQYIDREAFFAKLRQGVSVVIVKWRLFTGYDQPPHKLELGS